MITFTFGTALRVRLLAMIFALALPLCGQATSWEDERPDQVGAFATGNLAAVKRIVTRDPAFKEPWVIRHALSHAIASGNLELVKYLKSLGWLKVCHRAPDCQPLHRAVNAGANPMMVEFLISENFDVNEIARSTKRTPLQLAAMDGKFDFVKVLCENGADPNATYRMPNGETYPTALEDVKRSLSGEFYDTEVAARLKWNLTKIREYLEGGQCRKK
jgi:hypothetical protein